LAALLPSAAALSLAPRAVSGAAEGFAKGVTGGGSVAAVYPTTTAELVSYLGDSSPRVIVLTKTFDFTGSEGTVTATGCAPWGTASGCQTAIDLNSWCTNYEASAPKVSVTYDKAGILGITVASDKTLLGQGSAGIIKGKGLRIVSGAKNIIIQNIHITNLNPQYVWGGDAITVNNADMVWIDHVKVSVTRRTEFREKKTPVVRGLLWRLTCPSSAVDVAYRPPAHRARHSSLEPHHHFQQRD
jgi:pectin lyase